MQTKTLSERIAEIKNKYSRIPKAQITMPREFEVIVEVLNSLPEMFEIIEELQAENQALLAKNIKDAKEHHQAFKAAAEESDKIEKSLTALRDNVKDNTILISNLIADRDRYKHLWETDSAQAKEIIGELENQIAWRKSPST